MAQNKKLNVEDIRNIVDSEYNKSSIFDPNDGTLIEVILKQVNEVNKVRNIKKESIEKRKSKRGAKNASSSKSTLNSSEDLSITNNIAISIENALKTIKTTQSSHLTTSLSNPSIEKISQTPKEFLFDTWNKKVEVLNNRVKSLKASLENAANKEYPDVSFDEGYVSSSKIIGLIGRIICESENGFSKLNLTSIYLEIYSDKEETSQQNTIVKLQLGQYAINNSLQLFPGQIVAVIGVNKGHQTFEVSRIYTNASLPMVDFVPQVPDDSKIEGLKLIIASGPFLKDGKADTNFINLLKIVKEKLPGIFLLIGPFVEENTEYTQTYTEIFNELIKTISSELSSHTKIVLVPSLQDAHHFPIFPQPEFNLDFISDKKKKNAIISLTNPCIFDVIGLGGQNEFGHLRFGVSSQSILNDIEKLQFTTVPSSPVQLATLLLSQRSFYPLMQNSYDVPLDFSISEEVLHWKDFSPHILILPYSQAVSGMLPNGTLLICPKTLQSTENRDGGFVELEILVGPTTSELKAENFNIQLRSFSSS